MAALMSGRQGTRIESKRGYACELRRGFVALVLALFALGWLADRAHVAFETHEFCAEHQRIEHASEFAHDEAVHAHDAVGPVFEALDLDSDSHAACCTLLARVDDPIELPPIATRAFLTLALERPTYAHAWGTKSRASLEIVRFAPKQSPPAV